MTNNYYQKLKESLQKEASKKYQNLSDEKKCKKKCSENFQNFTEKGK